MIRAAPSVERERRHAHPTVAQRNEPRHAFGVLLLEQRHRVGAIVGLLPEAVDWIEARLNARLRPCSARSSGVSRCWEISCGVAYGHGHPFATVSSSRRLTSRARRCSAASRFPSGTSRRRPPGWMVNTSGVCHLERLAVDTGERLARTRTHLESLGGELVPVPALVASADRGEGDHRRGVLARRAAARAMTPSLPVSMRRRCGDVERGAEHVRVVRHLDEERAVDLGAVGRR